jgi:hypothetical protein
VLETGKERIAKDLAVCSQSPARPDTSDWTPVKRPLSGKVQRRTAKIHRTVRWCTRLSGEPMVASATVGDAIRERRVARANDRQGAPDCPVRQLARRCNGHLRQNRKEIGTDPSTVTVRWRTGLAHRTVYSDCPVRHPTEGKDGEREMCP